MSGNSLVALDIKGQYIVMAIPPCQFLLHQWYIESQDWINLIKDLTFQWISWNLTECENSGYLLGLVGDEISFWSTFLPNMVWLKAFVLLPGMESVECFMVFHQAKPIRCPTWLYEVLVARARWKFEAPWRSRLFVHHSN